VVSKVAVEQAARVHASAGPIVIVCPDSANALPQHTDIGQRVIPPPRD